MPPSTRKRPLPVWIIFIFYTLTSIYSALSIFLISSGAVTLPPEQQALLNSMTVFDRVIGYIVAAVTIVGVVLLLRLKKLAVPVLTLAFFLNLFSAVFFTLKTGALEMTDASGLALQAAGIVVFGVVCWYARSLDRSGGLD